MSYHHPNTRLLNQRIRSEAAKRQKAALPEARRRSRSRERSIERAKTVVASNRSVWDRLNFSKIGSWLKREDEERWSTPESREAEKAAKQGTGDAHLNAIFLSTKDSRELVSGLPRTLTSRRMQSETRDKLLEVPPEPERERSPIADQGPRRYFPPGYYYQPSEPRVVNANERLGEGPRTEGLRLDYSLPLNWQDDITLSENEAPRSERVRERRSDKEVSRNAENQRPGTEFQAGGLLFDPNLTIPYDPYIPKNREIGRNDVVITIDPETSRAIKQQASPLRRSKGTYPLGPERRLSATIRNFTSNDSQPFERPNHPEPSPNLTSNGLGSLPQTDASVPSASILSGEANVFPVRSTLRPAIDALSATDSSDSESNSSPPTNARTSSRPETYGWTRDHFVCTSTDDDTLSFVHPLGHGSLGVVEEVRHKTGRFPTFVRKRIQPRRNAATYFEIAREEVRILGSLRHPHIVSLIGSYEDRPPSRKPSYCILMSPVGESDLEGFLERVGKLEPDSEFAIQAKMYIRHWFACLASALSYMHASGVRHQDIKPSNIVHRGHRVLFTDFSSSSTFNVDHTTSTDAHARSTAMYGAPEMVLHRGKHGRTSDIFALGCVFCDMLTVMEGRSVSDFQKYLRQDVDEDDDPLRFLSYGAQLWAVQRWFADSDFFTECISRMLRPDRTLRPSADQVVGSLILPRNGISVCRCAPE